MKKNVLLVEDDPALRMVMREVLKDEFIIEEADNGVDGIDKGLNADNDLIILDYHLPKKNGLEVIEVVKAAHPLVPVIVLTGFLNPESEAQFNRLGANKIFPKPFNYRNLLETVRSLVLAKDGQAEPQQPKKEVLNVPQLSIAESEMFTDGMNTLANLAEKIEFLKSVSEKYWIEPNDINAIRETVRCMENALQIYYGKINNTVFNSGDFSSPLLASVNRPCLSGNN